MSLLLTISDIELTPDGKKALFTDETANYGAPEVERSAVAILLLPVYHYVDRDVVLLMDAYDPMDADAEYRVRLVDDGWLTLHAFAFPAAASPAAGGYAAGAVVYDTATGILSKNSGSAWVPVVDMLLHQADAVAYSKADHFPTPKQYMKLNAINKEEIDISFDLTPETECEHHGLLALKDKYYLLETRLGATHYEFLQGNKFVAQRNIEILNKRL